MSQRSVATNLRCGGTFSNRVIENCIQLCQWKNFENR